MILKTGRWSEAELDLMIRRASLLVDPGEKVEFISRQFLDIPYRESTLRGAMDIGEVLVIDLEGVDCFTLLDYIEAMRISASYGDLAGNVARVRYRDGKISFSSRNHFFTDWRQYNAERVDDVTEAVGCGRAKQTVKMLNLREDGSHFLPGIEVRRREVCFLPASDLSDCVMAGLRSGDYTGIYSELEGLDISHAGIIVKKGSRVYLRHASSSQLMRRVIDEDFMKYVSGKPGLVVLRPKA